MWLAVPLGLVAVDHPVFTNTLRSYRAPHFLARHAHAARADARTYRRPIAPDDDAEPADRWR
jgi:hypothetical protein